MKEIALKILACILSLAMAICNPLGDLWEMIQEFEPGNDDLPEFVAFEDMKYSRPDVDAYEKQVDICMKGAEEDKDADVLLEKFKTLYDMFQDFVTNYQLSNIYYSKDVTDDYWTEEYNFCTENTATVEAGLDEVLYALADSDLKDELEEDELFGDGFFDDYVGESIWDDTYTALADEENRLLAEYYAMVGGYGSQKEIAQLYVEMVSVRQDMATYLGYDNYLEYAYDLIYYRDYTPEEAMEYIEDIRTNLLPLYEDMDRDVWDAQYDRWSQKKTYAYVEEGAKAMGGIIWEAFQVMEKGGYYDIERDANKYNASFMTFLPTYGVPYIFMNAQGDGGDPMTFTHEFGHFCNNYASMGSDSGIDVAEVFSQALEFLSLKYCKDTDDLARMQMANALSVFAGQSFYADFENQVYLLDKDELTVENIEALYASTAKKYGFNRFGHEFVQIPHFFMAPVYVISYVTSADAALQIFQLEEKKAGAGLKVYMDNLDTQEITFLSFLESAGLESPFYKGRAAEIRETLEKYVT